MEPVLLHKIKVRRVCFLVALLSIFYVGSLKGQELSTAEQQLTEEKVLGLYIRIDAPLDSVWSRWTKESGIRKFFAPACVFEPTVLSLFESISTRQRRKEIVGLKTIASLASRIKK